MIEIIPGHPLLKPLQLAYHIGNKFQTLPSPMKLYGFLWPLFPLQSPLSWLCLLLGLSGYTGLLALVNTPSLFQLQLCSFLYPLCGNLSLNLSHPVSSHSQSTSLRVLLKCYLITKTSLTTTSQRVPFNPIYQPCNLSSFHICFL